MIIIDAEEMKEINYQVKSVSCYSALFAGGYLVLTNNTFFLP